MQVTSPIPQQNQRRCNWRPPSAKARGDTAPGLPLGKRRRVGLCGPAPHDAPPHGPTAPCAGRSPPCIVAVEGVVTSLAPPLLVAQTQPQRKSKPRRPSDSDSASACLGLRHAVQLRQGLDATPHVRRNKSTVEPLMRSSSGAAQRSAENVKRRRRTASRFESSLALHLRGRRARLPPGDGPTRGASN